VIFSPWSPEDLRREDLPGRNTARFYLLHEMGHIGPRNLLSGANWKIVFWRGVGGCAALPALAGADTAIGWVAVAASMTLVGFAPAIAVLSSGEPRLQAEAEADHFSLIAFWLWSWEAIDRTRLKGASVADAQALRQAMTAQDAVLVDNPLVNLRILPPRDRKLGGGLQEQVRQTIFEELRKPLRIHTAPRSPEETTTIFPPPEGMLRNLRRIMGRRMMWERMNILLLALIGAGLALPYVAVIGDWQLTLPWLLYALHICICVILGSFAALLSALGGVLFWLNHYSPATFESFLTRWPSRKGRVLHFTMCTLALLVRGLRVRARGLP
jgi:hypothetical protein